MNMPSAILLNTAQAAEYLHITPRTLKFWRLQGKGPCYVGPLGRRILYRPADLDDFIESCVCTPGPTAPGTRKKR